LFAQLHAPDLAYHFHGDHLLALLLKYSAEQLNTLVNFESALLGLNGQFSVGVNRAASQWRVLDAAHQKRNLAEYEGFLDVQEALVTELIDLAQKLIDDTVLMTQS
jgi:hypothetical protein